jgi:hypothetical protein
MDNNFNSTGQIKGEQFNGSAISSANSIREALNEFKDCVRLHEKGLQMQDDCVKQSDIIATAHKTRKKTVSAVVKSYNNKVSSDDLDEVNELRLNFAERHQ